MTPEEYKIKYPGGYGDPNGNGDWALHYVRSNEYRSHGYLLEFTEDTAYNWAGPHPGNCAAVVIEDCHYRLRPTDHYYGPSTDHPTKEYPIALRCWGNDDTSYTKFFSTKEEAIELLELLIANQPLDFDRDFYCFGFVSTN